MQKIALPESRIKVKGIFDWGFIYRELQKWFVKREFKFYETLYKDKPPEIEVDWRAERRVTSYIMYEVVVKFHMWDLEDVEVIKDGVKKKMNKARLEIKFQGTVITDWQEKWEESSTTKWWERVLNKYVLDKEMDMKYTDNLYYIVYDLQKLAKTLLEMEGRASAY